MAAAVHYWDDVVYVVGWFATVVAVWFVLQDYCPVAFVLCVAVFFTHCYRAATERLALVCFASRCMTGLGFLCRFVKCMLCQLVM